jgi:mitochondrial fission protein ELM1
MNADIWVLTDHRTGTATQATAVAEMLGMDYNIKKLRYNILALLPNILLGASLVHVNKAKSSDITEPLPKVIISSGRRTASVALALKKRKQDIKVIQIMRPFLDSTKFDLIVLPQHDKCAASPNILRIIGSLHNTETKINQSISNFDVAYPEAGQFIAMLIGGNTKTYTFSEVDAHLLAKVVRYISDNHGLPVFISFSRRTPNAVKAILRKRFGWPHIIYDPTENAGYNPYYGILAKCTFLITTCDSISMCSEATASGKPLYIFCPAGATMPKHKYFVQQLVDLKIAKLLTPDTEALEHYTYHPFNEALKVADFIKENVL